MADMAAREGASSARRRRDRQLRAWHRHVRTTVAMELATALHHSAQGPKKRVAEEPREEELLVKLIATSGQRIRCMSLRSRRWSQLRVWLLVLLSSLCR